MHVGWSFWQILPLIACIFLALLTSVPLHKHPDPIIPEYSKCDLCDVYPIGHISSTPRDVIIATYQGNKKDVSPLVRSIRTTGCRATIVLLTSDQDPTLPCSGDCHGIHVIGGQKADRSSAAIEKMRWEWMLHFLRQNQSQYDRVFHADAFDVFTYGDPFQLAPNPDLLYLAQEGNLVRACNFNSKWLKKCHGEFFDEIKDRPILCSGTLIGGIRPFIEFVDGMISEPEWINCWEKAMDQADFIFYYYMRYNQSNAQIIKCSEGINTVTYCSGAKDSLDPNGYVISRFGGTPAVILHQYNRRGHFKQDIQRRCHIK